MLEEFKEGEAKRNANLDNSSNFHEKSYSDTEKTPKKSKKRVPLIEQSNEDQKEIHIEKRKKQKCTHVSDEEVHKELESKKNR